MLLETKWQPKRLIVEFQYGEESNHEIYRAARLQYEKYYKITTEEGDREIKLVKNICIDLLDELHNIVNQVATEEKLPSENEEALLTAIKVAEYYNVPIKLVEDEDC